MFEDKHMAGADLKRVAIEEGSTHAGLLHIQDQLPVELRIAWERAGHRLGKQSQPDSYDRYLGALSGFVRGLGKEDRQVLESVLAEALSEMPLTPVPQGGMEIDQVVEYLLNGAAYSRWPSRGGLQAFLTSRLEGAGSKEPSDDATLSRAD